MTDKPASVIADVAIDSEIQLRKDLGDRGGWKEGVLGAIEANDEVERLDKENKKLEEENKIDELTGAGNLRALDEWLDRDEKMQYDKKNNHLERRKTGELYPTFGVMIFLDADGLGEENKKGHSHGNVLLQNIVAAASGITHRPLDVVFRKGDAADEFVICLPGDLEDSFVPLADAFNKSLREVSGENNFTASLAFGEYGNGVTAKDTLARLDSLLSKEKAGRPKGVHIDTIFDKRENNV